jgi:hypothetical protein
VHPFVLVPIQPPYLLNESSDLFQIRIAVSAQDMSGTVPHHDADEYNQDLRVIGVRIRLFRWRSPISLNCQYDPLATPALLRHEIKSSANSRKTVSTARFAAAQIISGRDDRVLVIVGPCSIHSPDEAIEYAHLLEAKVPELDNLLIIMRVYL